MTDRKAIILDLDGTLLTSDKTVSAFNAGVIGRCLDRGHLVIIATARPLRLVTGYLPEMFDDAYWAVYNGAWVCRHGNVIMRDEIDPDTALDTVRRLSALGLSPGVEADDRNYSDNGVEPGCERYHRPLADYHDRPACKVLSLITDGVSKADVLAAVPAGLTAVVTDSDTLVQISSGTCSKPSACRNILERECIPVDAVYVFGDDNNDIPLFEAFENGFAMGNATDALKERAKYVVPSNDEDGVGKGIEEYVLGAELE